MDYGILIAALKDKQCLTDLEKHILVRGMKFRKYLDRASAQKQVIQNNVKYPDIFAAISARPTVNIRPFTQVTESDIQYNLKEQLIGTCTERRVASRAGKQQMMRKAQQENDD